MHRLTSRRRVGLLAAALTFAAGVASAQLPLPPAGAAAVGQKYTGRAYSPYAERDFPDTVFWGDTHLHTSFSFDAGAFGNRLGLDAAYQFARGDEVTATSGYKVRLSRPLDVTVSTVRRRSTASVVFSTRPSSCSLRVTLVTKPVLTCR